MDPEIFLIIISAVFPILLISILFIESHRSKAVIQKWAENNRYKLIQKKQAFGDVGPFKWAVNQRVYRIKVEDENGSVRNGYACCGGFVTGIFSDRIEVKFV